MTNLTLPSRAEVRFYNKRGTAEQWIKEGKQAVKMTRLSCHRFRSNEVRLWLTIIAYNLGNLFRRLVLPQRIGNWSLTSLQQRLVKRGGRPVKHSTTGPAHLPGRFSILRTISALPLPDGSRPRREGNFRCSEVVGPDKCQRRGRLGRRNPHSDSEEQPKCAPLLPQSGQSCLRLSTTG